MRSDSSKADIERGRYDAMAVVSVCNVTIKLVYLISLSSLSVIAQKTAFGDSWPLFLLYHQHGTHTRPLTSIRTIGSPVSAMPRPRDGNATVECRRPAVTRPATSSTNYRLGIKTLTFDDGIYSVIITHPYVPEIPT
jgi:hypothetical protein